ncbi:MAG: ABC transporter permease [Candidatus Rokubacteria bacterium]|nr:ABC transporter permease [Candidatus Rokubacteria bacterium]
MTRGVPGVGLAVLAACFVTWELVSRGVPGLADYVPPASRALAALGGILASGELLGHARASLIRVGEGYALAAVVAVTAGVLLGASRLLYSFVEPLVELLRPMPSPATIPIAILFFGIGDEMKVVVTAYACTWPILLNTLDGVRGVDRVLRQTAATFRAGRWRTLFQVVVPAASPQIVTGLRVSLAIALILVTTSEMVVSNDGLGFYILDLQRSFRIPEMYAAILALAVLGYLLNRAFLALDGWVMAWHKGATRREAL